MVYNTLTFKAVLLVTVQIAVISAVPLEEFFAYRLSSNKQLIANDDGSSLPIVLNPPLRFYGRGYNECQVHNNGIVSLNDAPVYFINDPFPLENYTFIAPFYGDVDTRAAGTVWFSDPVSRNGTMRERAKAHITNAFTEYKDFSPSYLIVATWDHVGYYREHKDMLNTFQCVIATDGSMSFAIFLYNETEWSTQNDPDDPSLETSPAKIGFNEGILNKSWEVPCSRSSNVTLISTSSNIGVPGIWIFRIDQGIVQACPNEGDLADCEDDELCSCLTEDSEKKCKCEDNSKYAVCMKPASDTGSNFNDNSRKIGISIGVTVAVIAMLQLN